MQMPLNDIRDVIAGAGSRETKARQIAEAIREAGSYRWAGLYDVSGGEIAAIAWSGPGAPAHPRFPATQGLCGAAVSSGATIVAGDVAADPRYLTTLGSTRSEIVVPVRHPVTQRVAGLIQVESAHPNAFKEEDRLLLEKCAAAIAGLWET